MGNHDENRPQMSDNTIQGLGCTLVLLYIYGWYMVYHIFFIN